MQSYNVDNAPDLLGPFVVPIGDTEMGVATYRRNSTQQAGSYKGFEVYLANGPGRWVVHYPANTNGVSEADVIPLIIALG